ncbi:ISKra4 family transposase [Zooshikella ganghwensis]|uniref:ISKra4 family transposase n=2 Tax=Zooshikella ganghwensis TaxID=202772 RepID=A0A4P9VPS5_9GAMM|nr:ISKra4 family transposase [Zooshikella ganghwensis]
MPARVPMIEAYNNLLKLESFISATQQFEALVVYLASQGACLEQHGNIEQYLQTAGNELLRRLLQGHLDHRATHERPRQSVTGADGIRRTYCRQFVPRRLATVFGEVTVTRHAYQKRGHHSLYPMDQELNLSADKYSDGLRQRVAIESSKSSFDETVRSIAFNTGGAVPKRQSMQLVTKAAIDFEAFYQTRADQKESTSNLLVITTDAKGIVMHKEDLRETTKQAVAKQQHKLKSRLSPGEKANRKRMARVASVYTTPCFERTPEQIIRSNKAHNVKRPSITNKRIWASVERSSEQVIQEAMEEAIRRDPDQQRDWVVLVDGETSQLASIEAELKAQSLGATVIVDFIHVLEYLWKAARCFYSLDTDEIEQWVKGRGLKILQGKCVDVAAGMRRRATVEGLSQDRRKAVDTCANYLQKYRDYLKYDRYLEKGYPIATGVIEGACRHLINDRLGITGARWRLSSAEAILKIRSIRSSGDFEAYWEFHKKNERVRNHTSLYAKSQLLEAA